MERKITTLLVALIAFLLVASILPLDANAAAAAGAGLSPHLPLDANAAAAAGAGLSPHPDKAQQQVYYPQRCRCCFFVGRVPNIQCGRACCGSNAGEDCC